MRLHGLLSLHREIIGTVALVAAGSATVISVTTTAPNGRFNLDWPPLPPGSVLYGFPGQVLERDEIADALADGAGTIFEAIVPLVPTERLIFVNALSTCVSAVLRPGFAFGGMPASVAT